MAPPWQSAPESYRLNQFGLTAKLPFRGLTPGLQNLSLPFGANSRRLPGPVLAVRTLQASGTTPFRVAIRASRATNRLRATLVDVQLDASTRCPASLHLYWSAAKARQLDLEILVTTTDPFQKLEV